MLRRRSRDSKRTEFERFVAEVADELLRTGYLLVWDLAEAEDLVQEVLMRVAKRWPKVQAMEYPRAYARRILVNLVIDGAKTRTRRRDELDPPADTLAFLRREVGVDGGYSTVDAHSELTDALGSLPPQQRAVLVLRYFEDMTEADIAKTLGCSIGTVKSTASRALARLQARMATPDDQLIP